jgi:hypothetical protein
MSTYYNFYCTKCKKYQKDISFTRQGWGWGNADIIATFQFLMKHTDECGHEHIKICSEYDRIIDCAKERNPPDSPSINDYTKDTSEDLLYYFPSSDDWPEDSWKEQFEKHLKYKREKDASE